MPAQELPIDTGSVLLQTSECDSLIRHIASLVLPSTIQESIWDITNRVCDRYLRTNAS